MVLVFGLFVGLLDVSLWPLVPASALRLVLESGHGLGAGVGDVALLKRLLRMGAAATARLLQSRNWFHLP